MKIEIRHEDFQGFCVDRDGVRSPSGGQGFDVFLEMNVRIHFEEEDDAACMTKAILNRLESSV